MASNLQFIKSESGDAVSSFTIEDIFSAKYNVYQIYVLGNGSQGTSSITFEFLDSSDADIAQGAYDYALLRCYNGSGFDDIYGADANSVEFAYTSSTDHDFAAVITVYDPFSSSTYTHCTFESMSSAAEKGIFTATSSTSAVSMKFYANQNFTPIKVSAYGVL